MVHNNTGERKDVTGKKGIHRFREREGGRERKCHW